MRSDLNEGQQGRAHESGEQRFQFKLVVLGQKRMDSATNSVGHDKVGGNVSARLGAQAGM